MNDEAPFKQKKQMLHRRSTVCSMMFDISMLDLRDLANPHDYGGDSMLKSHCSIATLGVSTFDPTCKSASAQ
jgi:hypothetical protein